MAEDFVSKLSNLIDVAQQNKSNFVSGSENRAISQLGTIESTLYKAFDGIDFNDANQIARVEDYTNSQINNFRRQYPSQSILIDGLENDANGMINHYKMVQADYNNDLINYKSAINNSKNLVNGGLDAAFSATSFTQDMLSKQGDGFLSSETPIVNTDVINDTLLQEIKKNEEIINNFNMKYFQGSADLSGVPGPNGSVIGGNRFFTQSDNRLPMDFYEDIDFQTDMAKVADMIPFLKNEYVSRKYENTVIYKNPLTGDETPINTVINPDEKRTVEAYLNNDIDRATFLGTQTKIEQNKVGKQTELLNSNIQINNQRYEAKANIDSVFRGGDIVLSLNPDINGAIYQEGLDGLSIGNYNDYINQVINNPDLEDRDGYIEAFNSLPVNTQEIKTNGVATDLIVDEQPVVRRMGEFTNAYNNSKANIIENSKKYLSFASDTNPDGTPNFLNAIPMENKTDGKGNLFIQYDDEIKNALLDAYQTSGYMGSSASSEIRELDITNKMQQEFDANKKQAEEEVQKQVQQQAQQQATVKEKLELQNRLKNPTDDYLGESEELDYSSQLGESTDYTDEELDLMGRKYVIDYELEGLETQVKDIRAKMVKAKNNQEKYRIFSQTKKVIIDKVDKVQKSGKNEYEKIFSNIASLERPKNIKEIESLNRELETVTNLINNKLLDSKNKFIADEVKEDARVFIEKVKNIEKNIDKIIAFGTNDSINGIFDKSARRERYKKALDDFDSNKEFNSDSDFDIISANKIETVNQFLKDEKDNMQEMETLVAELRRDIVSTVQEIGQLFRNGKDYDVSKVISPATKILKILK